MSLSLSHHTHISHIHIACGRHIDRSYAHAAHHMHAHASHHRAHITHTHTTSLYMHTFAHTSRTPHMHMHHTHSTNITHLHTHTHTHTHKPHTSKRIYVANVYRSVTVSLVTIKGVECRVLELGRVADTTGGNVTQVDPLTVSFEFSNIVANPIIATNVECKLILHNRL